MVFSGIRCICGLQDGKIEIYRDSDSGSVEGGLSVKDVCLEHGISENIY